MDTPMPETTETPSEESQTEITDESTDTTPEGAEALGDAGKKALDAMKAERKTLKAELRELKSLLAERDKPDSDTADSPDVDAIRREATQAANSRILKAEIKAAAAGKLNKPEDALLFLDLSAFDVSESGDVDAEEISDAIADLIKERPYLGPATAPKFQGTGDGGAARKASGPSQLTREDLKGMSPDAIVQARKDGRLSNLFNNK